LQALVLAPNGRDAPLTVLLLKEAGIAAEICADLASLTGEMKRGAGLAVIADEAVQTADLRPLVGFLEGQPPWSDMPIILLTHRGGGPERNPAALRLGEILGNVSFLERPFHPTTLSSMVRAAIRGRRRQYEARARLDEISEREQQLQTALGELAMERTALSNLTRTLEERVAERTGELMMEVAAREKAQEQLLQSQKMESVGQLTGGIAHDFNNLLMAVMGNLEILRKRLRGEPGIRRLIDGAMQGAQRGASLTQRMLAFARQQDLKTVSADIGGLVSGMQELLRRSLGPRDEHRRHAGGFRARRHRGEFRQTRAGDHRCRPRHRSHDDGSGHAGHDGNPACGNRAVETTQSAGFAGNRICRFAGKQAGESAQAIEALSTSAASG
jgi:signal transduction histidine kinase